RGRDLQRQMEGLQQGTRTPSVPEGAALHGLDSTPVPPTKKRRRRKASVPRRRGSKDARPGREATRGGSTEEPRFSRIGGVRIAYIGAGPGSIDGIRRYWEERGASFVSRPDLPDVSFVTLCRLFGPADVVFVCAGRLGKEASHQLKAYCDYAE